MKELHPLLRPRGFVAATRPLIEFNEALSGSWVRTEPAFVVYGASRNGKTTAIEDLHYILLASRTMVPFWSFTDNYDKAGVAPKFWRSFHSGPEPLTDQMAFGSPFEALVARIRTACDKADTPKVVLMFDVAQALDIQRLDMLKHLTETLIRFRLAPYVLLVGQPDIVTKAKELKAKGRYDLVARFFVREHRFRGLNEDDFPSLLEHYDKATWPRGGPSYAGYFIPELVDRSGWRMAAQSRYLWAAFAREATKLRVKESDLEVGTEAAVLAALALLQELAKQPGRAGTQELFDEAVALSTFAKSFKVVGDAEKAAKAKVPGRRDDSET